MKTQIFGLDSECAELGLPLIEVGARRAAHTGLWLNTFSELRRPEEIVLERYLAEGWVGSWCEGGTVNLLMKSAAFPVLVRENKLKSREDARRRFFEAQVTVLVDRHEEILRSIYSATRRRIEDAALEILSDDSIRTYYRNVSASILMELWETLGAKMLGDIATIYVGRPYDLRAGWPDLTLLQGGRARFVEVKTSDLLTATQRQVIRHVALPLALDFAVARVRPP